MEPDSLTVVRDRAYQLADSGKLKSWAEISRALADEGHDMFLLRRLEGDAYLKFRLQQRIEVAQKQPRITRWCGLAGSYGPPEPANDD